MKKLLAVLLSATLLFTSCLYAFSTLADESNTKDYSSPTSWGLYKVGSSAYPSTLDGTSIQSWMFSESTTVLCSGQNSLKIDGAANLATAATKLEGLTADTVYAVTFKYYVPSAHTPGSAGYIFKAGVYKTGAPVVTGGAVSDTSYMLSSQQNVSAATGVDTNSNPIWQEMTLTFTATAEDQYLGFSFRYGGSGDDYGNIYFADIEVNSAEHCYADASNWGAYKVGNAAYPSIIDGTSTQRWLFAESETILYEGQRTMVFTSNSNISTAATKLVDLEIGKKYMLSFKYHVPSNLVTGSQSFIFSAGIYRKDAPLTNSYTVDSSYALADPVNIVNSTGIDINNNYNWGEASIIFTAEAEQYLALSFLFGGVDNIYLSDIKVETAPKEYNLPASWGLYKVGNSAYPATIDGSSAQNWMFYEETNIKSGEENSIRFGGSTNLAAAATKLEKLTPNKKYSVTFKYYIPSSHVAGSGGYIFKAGIYKKGSPVVTGGDISDTSYQITDPVSVSQSTGTNADSNAVWGEVTFTFRAVDEQYLVISLRYGASAESTEDYGNLYFTDFEVTEVLKAYNLPEDYALYKTGSTAYPDTIDGTSAHSWMFHEETAVKYNDENSVRFDSSSNVATAATKLENLKYNKKYKLTFRYYIPASHTAGSGGYIFKAGIYKKDAPIASGGLVTDTSYQLATPVSVTEATGRDSSNEPIWKDVSLVFDAQQEQYLGISLRYMGSGEDYGNIYIAKVQIKEVMPEKDYEAPSSWATYRNGKHTAINGVGISSLISETQITHNGGEKSLKMNKENLATSATKLQNLTEGKKYAVVFKYYITSETAKGSGGYIFKAGVYKENAPLAIGVNVTDEDYIVAPPVSVTEATGKDSEENPIWADFVTSFTATEEDLYFGISVRVTPAEGVSDTNESYALIYIDDFEIFEIGAVDLGPASEKIVVDFEDDTKTYVDSKVERFEIVTANNYAEQSSKMLYYKSGSYIDETEFNNIKISIDNDPNFTLPINPNKVYKVSYRYKIASADTATDWLSFYTSYGGVCSKSKNYNLCTAVAKDTWHTYETYYSPELGQTYVSLSFKLGKVSSGVWIDDITLEETDRAVFGGHTAGQTMYQIDFDDYNVPMDNPFIKVEDAPARDGSVSKAAHISKVTTSEAVTLNSLSISDGTEKVFAIPVEPDTNYIWSFWSYAVSEKPTTFNFYYNNYTGAKTTNNIFSYHKQDITVGSWQKHTVEFKTDKTQTMLYTWFNAGTSTTELWIDDITLEKMSLGTVSETDLFYCEDFYNLIGKEEAHENLSNAVTGVYEVSVPENTVVTFSVKASGSGSMTLSADGETAMSMGSSIAPASTISFTGAQDQASINVFTGSLTKIYIIVNNTQGLNIDELMMFSSKSTHFANTVMGYATNPEAEYTQPVTEVLQTK